MPIDTNTLQVRMAAERTLLAWIRTGLAIMVFGFGVARYEAPKFDAALIGASLILFGAAALALSGREYGRLLRRFAPDARTDATTDSPRSYAGPVARLVALVGVGLAAWFLIRARIEARPVAPVITREPAGLPARNFKVVA